MTATVKRAILAVTIILMAVGFATCSPLFVIRAGHEQVKILSRREPIRDLAEDPRTTDHMRHKLALVLQAREFAANILRLDAGDSYTMFSQVDGDTLLLVLAGARKDRFEPVTWWFPIVGRVSYKGYFNHSAARRAAERLEQRGYDTVLRPANAFSTLGWFNDPMLSTMLRYDDLALVSVVIHELAHNTLWLRGQLAFNESFATFVGDRGAIAFYCAREGEEAPECQQAQDRWHDTLVFGRFLSRLISSLEALYDRTDLPTDTVLARREQVFQQARLDFQQRILPELRTPRFRGFPDWEMNNAILMARRTYYKQLDIFEEAFHHLEGQLETTIHSIVQAAKAEPAAPYQAVARMVGSRKRTGKRNGMARVRKRARPKADTSTSA